MSNTKKPQSKRLLTILAALIVALLAGMGIIDLPGEDAAPAALPTAAVQAQTVQSGPIIEPQAIADYLFEHGELPENFITKSEAKELGWDSRYHYVSDAAPGKSIGGDRFGNYEGLLPKSRGRTYYECDCWYIEGPRNAYRLIFSYDGLYYYTEDHYQTFTQLFPEEDAEE